MDQIITELTRFASFAKEESGFLPPSNDTLLDEFCTALKQSANQTVLSALTSGQILRGLQTVAEITYPGKTQTPALSSGAWRYSLQAAPFGESTLILSRVAPQPLDLYFRLGPDQTANDVFLLAESSPAGEQVIAFDLEERPDGWYLRREEAEQRVSSRLDVPGNAPVSWRGKPSYDFVGQLLPGGAGGILAWINQISTAVSSQAKQAVRAAPLQTCRACGAPLQPGMRFCGQCATPVEAEQATLQEVQAPLRPLTLLHGQTRIPLKGRFSIGRSPDNDLQLSDAKLSRRHALLEETPAGWRLSDQASTNGTRLNGLLITTPQTVKAGDVIEIGDTRLTLI